MASKSVTTSANELSVAMAELDKARVIASLAVKAEGLNPDDARNVFYQLQSIMDDVHNQVDCVREDLEA